MCKNAIYFGEFSQIHTVVNKYRLNFDDLEFLQIGHFFFRIYYLTVIVKIEPNDQRSLKYVQHKNVYLNAQMIIKLHLNF